jgi:hypothetical protein
MRYEVRNSTTLETLPLPPGMQIDPRPPRPIGDVEAELVRVRASVSELTDRVAKLTVENNSLKGKLDQALKRLAAPGRAAIDRAIADADASNASRANRR